MSEVKPWFHVKIKHQKIKRISTWNQGFNLQNDRSESLLALSTAHFELMKVSDAV